MERIKRAFLPNDRSLWPLLLSSLFFLSILTALIVAALRACQQHFGYPLDDTYIHMAMAKNFALHRVWGITRYEFSSSTSSPFFTLLLSACYALTGVRELTPLILNIVAGLLLLAFSDFLLINQNVRPGIRCLLLCFVVLAAPLPTLVFLGMEHVFHALATLMFAHFCATYLAGRQRAIPCGILFGLTAILASIRYEAIFLAGTAGLLFLIQKRWKVTAALALAAGAPLALYGAICVSQGWYAVPNSLLIKANLPSSQSTGLFGTFFETLRNNFLWGFHILLLASIAALLLHAGYRVHRMAFTYGQNFLLLMAAGALLHLLFARVGWFWRYEAYLITGGILAIVIGLCETGLRPRSRLAFALYALAAAVILIFSHRTYNAFSRTALAVSDIYDQQYQVGLFARDNLAGRTVVMNDIGAVSFLSDARVLDLIGLGSLAPLTARLHHRYSPDWLGEWSRGEGAAVAITYPWFAAPGWTKVSTWKIPGNYMSASDTVAFFAVNPSFKGPLAASLERFRSRLPSRVIEQ